MKTVHLNPDNTVREIIPEYGLPVKKWYGADFAARCRDDAPDDVAQGWHYDPESGAYTPPEAREPPPAPPDPLAALDALAVEHELRITLLELGV